MTERYCEGERFADLSFTEEALRTATLPIAYLRIALYQVRTGSYHVERVQIRAV